MTDPDPTGDLFRAPALAEHRERRPPKALDLRDRLADRLFWILAAVLAALVVAAFVVPTGRGTVVHLLVG